jgi:geranylgeranyl transferase type-2 subunit beta
MLQVARLAPKLLGESRDLVESFLRSQINPDGGFRNRAGDSDLYYTVFGLESLVALQAELPIASASTFLHTFGCGGGLDFVHHACLARCWATIARQPEPAIADAILARIESHRTYDGGYDQSPDAIEASAYAMFVALGAYQDCGRPLPKPDRFADSLEYLPPPDVTPVAAAVATLARHCQRDPDPALAQWLLERHRPEGGFFAVPAAPLPDLLSTATALHALAGMHVPLDALREPCLDFVDSLWTNRGGFYGNWSDDAIDAEYTYYALLALGHLTE